VDHSGSYQLTFAHPTQVTLDHFVMVRIHARQPLEDERLTKSRSREIEAAYALLARFFGSTFRSNVELRIVDPGTRQRYFAMRRFSAFFFVRKLVRESESADTPPVMRVLARALAPRVGMWN
jgi:hypothetical protein